MNPKNTRLTFLLLTLMCWCLIPSLNAQTELKDNGNLQTRNYLGSAEDFIIPLDYAYNSITFTLNGGDGGGADAFGCRSDGGEGATTEFTIRIGEAEGFIPPGAEIRFVVGEGGATQVVDDLKAVGGGGGGTAVLARMPGDTAADDWIILGVAGGGGGAYQGYFLACVDSQNGQGGRATTTGGDGEGDFSGDGGNSGQGGEGGGGIGGGNFSGGGGGAFSDGEGNNGKGGKQGYPAGGTFGDVTDLSTEGGWGFGGGGSGEDAGCGGGGYSGGGGGGSFNNGGGGGSYVNPDYAIDTEITAGGTASTSKDGFVTYLFKDLCAPSITGFSYINQTCNSDGGLSRIQINYTNPEGENACNSEYTWTLRPINGWGNAGNGEFSAVRPGEYTVLVSNTTLTSDQGAVVVASYTFTVEANTDAPDAQCKAVTVTLNSSGTYSNSNFANLINDGSTSYCDDPLSLSVNTSSFDCSDIGTARFVTLTVTGSNGVSDDCSALVTVQRNAADAVSLNCSTSLTVDLEGNAITLDPTDIGSASSTGACGNASIDLTLSQSAFDCDDIGQHSVTLTANNGVDTDQCTATVYIVDNGKPTALCQDPFSVALNSNGQVSISADQIDNSSYTNNCTDIVSYVLDKNIFDCDDVGDVQVRLTVRDGYGRTAACNTTITITDNPSTEITCQDITISLDDNGRYTLDPSEVLGSASSYCALTYELSTSSFACADIGTESVTLTATDLQGNETSCTSNVTVVDDTAPTAVCNDITAEVYAGVENINSAFYTSQATIGSADNCGSFSARPIDGPTIVSCTDAGEIIRTYEIKDDKGNTSTCQSTVTIVDRTQPRPGCIETFTVQLGNDGTASITADQLIEGVNDDCGTVFTYELDKSTFDCDDLEDSQTVRVDVTDEQGNSNWCSTSVTVVDDTAPNIVCNDITVALNEEGRVDLDDSEKAALFNGTSDNCGAVSQGISTPFLDCDDLGDHDFELTATDFSGNQSSCTAVVTVVDDSAPNIVCNDITIALDDEGTAIIGPTQSAALSNGTTDNCGTFYLAFNTFGFDCNDLGDRNVKLTATDAEGNKSSCNAVVTITDEMAPLALAQDITVQLDASGAATITAADIDNGSTDNCGIQSLAVSPSSFDCSQVGDNIVTLTVMDNSGNESETTATVTVADNVAPTARCKPAEIYLDNTNVATLSVDDINFGSTDDCGIAIYTLDQSSFDCSSLGDHTVKLTVRDEAGNAANCSASVKVVDPWAPSIVCNDITMALDATGVAVIGDTELAALANGTTDNCVNYSLSTDISSFNCNSLGDQSVRLTATDSWGNEASCRATVTIIDDVAPIVSCNDISIQLNDAGEATITEGEYSILVEGVSDNCNSAVSIDKTFFTCEDLGDNTVTITAEDLGGNVGSCQATVTVLDKVAPIALAQDITVQLDANGSVTITAVAIDNGSSDACGIQSIVVSPNNFDCSQIGANTVTLTVRDKSGNQSEASATVTVQDNMAPSVVCNAITMSLDDRGYATIGAAELAELSNGTTDNCDFSLDINRETFRCSNIGDQDVVLTATDPSGNSSSCTAIVTIIDDILPDLSCHPITIQLDDAGVAEITLADYAVMVELTEICNPEVTVEKWFFGCEDLGVNLVTVDVKDLGGNEASCQAEVTVVDEIKPTLTCPTDMTVSTDQGECGAYVTLPKAAPADNCSIEAMQSRYRLLDDEGTPIGNWYGWQPDHSGFFEPGTYQVQWRASDPSGNSRFCSIQLRVIDEEAPEVACQDVTVNFNGEETIAIESEMIFDQAASFDACGPVNFFSQSVDEISCASVGEIVLVEVVGVDQHGNTSTCTAAVTVDGNPCGFTATDIECSEGASASYDPTTDRYTLMAKDCEGYPDGEYSLMTTELCGDGEIIAKVASLSGDGRAGVIMMESLAPDARFVSKIKDFTPRTRTEYRSSTGGNLSYKSKNRSGVKWLKIVRAGSKFKTYTSTNGSYWRLSHTITYSNFADCIQVGLITYSKQANDPVTAVFEQVKVNGDSPSALEQITTNPVQDLQSTNTQQLRTDLGAEMDLSVAPNPFSIQTQIEFTLPTVSDVTLEIYNLHGQRVHSLENARLDAGTHRYQWEGQSSEGKYLPTGIYMLRLRANKKWFTTKVSLVNR